ncbi:hypothetical protein ASE85_01420 [Sphingobium sp. Leaf26]|uniref:ArnT family glycosyltransferase n=1 Tax=Sphingobium sp. Leaf26 TaxID=1735693 RepID=UPI0006FE7D8D|nr:hypothetical protein [Sphingobium sp. Leaf26]KQN09641.1 hypothetical protein ASE85_01420 [Sphingobium sp. Leaf26]
MTARADVAPAGPVARAMPRRWLVAAGLSLIFLLLLWHLASLLSYIRFTLGYPFQLDYGEGIVWQQARNIWAGEGYAPLRLFPAVVYHYPPLYHLTFEALAAWTGLDEMVAGRLVSILSSGFTAVIVALLTRAAIGSATDARTRNLCGVFAALLFLACFPVRMWTPLLRVDMLAGLLGVAGLWFAHKALARPGHIYLASAMFVLGMFVKQISVAPPAAVFLILLVTNRPLAVRGLAAAMAMGLAGLAIEQWLNGSEFLRHIVGYNVNRIDPRLLRDILLPQLSMHAAVIVLGLVGAVAGWRHVREVVGGWTGMTAAGRKIADDPKAVLTLMLMLFVAFKTVMLLAMLKSGANYNYMVEWFSGIAIFAGVAIAPYVGFSLGKAAPDWHIALVALLFVALPVQLVALFGLYAGQPETRMIERLSREKQPIVDLIAATDRPVISDDMTFPIRAGRKVEWEAAITAELGASGVYDQKGFAELVRAHCFGFFVIDGILGTPPSSSLYDPGVIAAIREAYPHVQHISKYRLYFPDAPADPGRCASVR